MKIFPGIAQTSQRNLFFNHKRTVFIQMSSNTRELQSSHYTYPRIATLTGSRTHIHLSNMSNTASARVLFDWDVTMSASLNTSLLWRKMEYKQIQKCICFIQYTQIHEPKRNTYTAPENSIRENILFAWWWWHVGICWAFIVKVELILVWNLKG